MPQFGNGSPIGVVVPKEVGDEYYDFQNHQRWIATGLNFATWELSSGEAAVAPASYPVQNSVPLTILTVPLAQGQQAGGIVDFLVRCSDGTDFQPIKGHFEWAAANKGGTITFDHSPFVYLPNGNTKSGGSIQVDITSTQSGSTLLIQLVVTSSLTPAAGAFTVSVSSRNL